LIEEMNMEMKREKKLFARTRQTSSAIVIAGVQPFGVLHHIKGGAAQLNQLNQL